MSLEEFTLPLCLIPKEITQNYEERVREFYSQGKKKEIERSLLEVERVFGIQIKSLIWNDKRGLANITLSASCGLDLERNRYVFHNIYDEESNEARAAFEIAKKYLELL